MDISVLLAIYGVENYIEKSLNSLFSQTKTDGVEFILVNDCTKDKSMQIAQKVIERYPNLTIKVINHEKNLGLAVARQTGIDNATGTYTIHFDPDDLCEPTMLEDLYNKAIEDNADIVMCDHITLHPTREEYIKINLPKNRIEALKLLLSNDLPSPVWNKLIKRSIYENDNVKWEVGIDFTEDFLICIKIFYYLEGKISLINKPYYTYIKRPGSYTNESNPKSYLPANKAVLKFFEDKPERKLFINELTKIKISTLYHGGKGERISQIMTMIPSIFSKKFLIDSFEIIISLPHVLNKIVKKIKRDIKRKITSSN